MTWYGASLNGFEAFGQLDLECLIAIGMSPAGFALSLTGFGVLLVFGWLWLACVRLTLGWVSLALESCWGLAGTGMRLWLLSLTGFGVSLVGAGISLIGFFNLAGFGVSLIDIVKSLIEVWLALCWVSLALGWVWVAFGWVFIGFWDLLALGWVWLAKCSIQVLQSRIKQIFDLRLWNTWFYIHKDSWATW